MAFIVEDGAGLAGANSYLAVADADTYHTDNNQSAWSGTDAEKQAALIKASRHVDGHYRFKGAKASAAQALEWPRSGATDWSGHVASGLPQRLKDAVAELALAALSADLDPALERGGAAASERIGDLAVTYADDALPGTVHQLADKLLAPYVLGTYDPHRVGRPCVAMPYNGGDDRESAAAYFTSGMMDADR